jgi:hypothetical protein
LRRIARGRAPRCSAAAARSGEATRLMDTSGTPGLTLVIMRGIMIGATVVSLSAGASAALLWKEAMCARR